MLAFNVVKKRFPEARIVEASTGLEYNVHCPKPHKHGGHYKMYINASEEVAHCHDCGWAANAREEFFPLADELFPGINLNRDTEEILELYVPQPSFAKFNGVTMENGVPLPGVLERLEDLPMDHPAIEYLSSRGFDVDEIRSFDKNRELFYVKGLGDYGAGIKNTIGRILFPIRSGGVLCGWQARRIDRAIIDNDTRQVWDGKKWTVVFRNNETGEWKDKHIPKYYTSKGMQVGQALYNLDAAREYNRVTGSSYAILCEGPLDVIKVGIKGIGSFGQPTSTQKKIIDASFDFIVVLLDPDINPYDNPGKYKKYTEGWGIPSISLHLPNGKDPGSTDRAVIAASIESELKKRAGIKTTPPKKPIYE